MHKSLNLLLSCVLMLVLVGCAGDGPKTIAPKKATSRPYTIKGQTYYPQEHYEYDEEGTASYYGVRDGFHGKKTATGEVYDAHGITAAHKTLPLPTVVRVTNLENGRSLTVKVNDRGPFPKGRVIDVSEKCAKLLGFYGKGTAKVRVQSLVEETLALQKNPKGGHVPMLMAHADAEPEQVVLPKSTVVAVADKKKEPQHRPGYQAVNDLIQAKSKPQIMVAAGPKDKLNANPTVSLAATVPAARGVYIKAGTFTRLNNAERLSSRLKPLTKTVPVRLNTVSVNKTPMFMVKVGPFKTTEEAQQLIQEMAKAGHKDAQIITE